MKQHSTTLIFSIVAMASFALAENETIPISLENQDLGHGAVLMQDDGGSFLSITAQEDGNPSIHLFDIETPEITGDGYAV